MYILANSLNLFKKLQYTGTYYVIMQARFQFIVAINVAKTN